MSGRHNGVAIAERRGMGRLASHRFSTCVPKNGQFRSPFLAFDFLTERGLGNLGIASVGGAERNRTLGVDAPAKILALVLPPEQQEWFGSLVQETINANRLRARVDAEVEALVPSILSKVFCGEL